MGKKLRIGIIGAGGIAHAHMKSYLEMSDVEIIGASDIVPGKARAFLDEFGLAKIPGFDDNASLLQQKPDGVSVCSYNNTHSECACAAMEAGVNVLCEKPMSVTLEQAIQMARCQVKTGKILTIGFQPRYDENMKMVKQIVRSGALGHIYYVQTGGGRRRGMPGGTFIKKDLAGVGCLADIGCYGLDMALNSVGYRKPVTVSAYASNHFGTNPKYHPNADEFEVDDFTSAFIRFEDGLVVYDLLPRDRRGAVCAYGIAEVPAFQVEVVGIARVFERDLCLRMVAADVAVHEHIADRAVPRPAPSALRMGGFNL